MSMAPGQVGLSGTLSLTVIRGSDRRKEARRRARWWRLRNALAYRWREWPLWLALLLRWCGLTARGSALVYGKLYLQVRRGDGTVEDLGLAGMDLVVTAGKNYVASTFDNTAEPESMKFHGFGTGVTAAAIGDTALQTEETTQYATDNTRPTGSQAHSSNTYTTVATYTPDSGGTRAITEWGLLSQAANSGGTMLDHQVFSAVNLDSTKGDSLQATYTLTIS